MLFDTPIQKLTLRVGLVILCGRGSRTEVEGYPNHFVLLYPFERPSGPGKRGRHDAALWDERALSSVFSLDFSDSEGTAGYRAMEKLGSKEDPMDRNRGPTRISASIALWDAVCNFQGGR